MTLDEILDELRDFSDYFPEQALREAIDRPREISPYLHQALRRPQAEIFDDERYFLHLYALYLLAQYRDRSAFEPMLRFFGDAQGLGVEVTGDVVTEGLARMLASVYNGDLPRLQQFIEDQDIDEWARTAGLDCLVLLVAAKQLPRHLVLEYFASLLTSITSDTSTILPTSLASAICHLHPGELLTPLKALYEQDRIDERHLPWNEVESANARSMDDQLARRSERRPLFIEDSVAELKPWACFNPDPEPMASGDYCPTFSPLLEKMDDQLAGGDAPTANYRQSKKIGRNDPCPCGSGKKFKKCCLPLGIY